MRFLLRKQMIMITKHNIVIPQARRPLILKRKNNFHDVLLRDLVNGLKEEHRPLFQTPQKHRVKSKIFIQLLGRDACGVTIMRRLLCSLTVTLLLFSCNLYANEKLTVLLDWLPNAGHAPLFVAKEKDFFKAEGLDVDLIGPVNPSDPPKLVAAGKTDIAITYEPQFMEQVDQGLPLIRIGTLVDKPLDCLITLEESKIATISDLKGKRIGYATGSINSVSLKTMLENNHLSLSDVKQINVNYNLVQPLLTKKVDAVTGVMRTFEVIQLELNKHPVRAFFPEKNGVPTYSELIFVANTKNITDPRFKKFLVALKKAGLYLQKNPEETWKIFSKNHPELNDELNHRAWFSSLPYFAENPNIFNEKEWLDFANFLYKNGLIQKVQPMERYAIDLIAGTTVIPLMRNDNTDKKQKAE